MLCQPYSRIGAARPRAARPRLAGAMSRQRDQDVEAKRCEHGKARRGSSRTG